VMAANFGIVVSGSIIFASGRRSLVCVERR
jgi:hypothetical protein